MRRICLTLLLPLLCLTACAEIPQVPAETVPVTESTETSASETEAAAETKIRVYDLCDVLTAEEEAQFSAYLDELCRTRSIEAALVVTDDLGGKKPAVFAQLRYNALCGAGNDGFLVLINNATGEDILLTEGRCRDGITDTDVLIAQATPALVEGRYADGAAILLSAGEQLPQ